jgi:hypothetical protein
MRALEKIISDLDAAVAKLQSARTALTKLRDDMGAVEKARESLRGRRRPKDGESD